MINNPIDRVVQVGGLIVGATGVALTAYSLLRQRDVPVAETTPTRWLDPGEPFLLLGDSIGEGIQVHLNKLSNDYGSTLTSRVKRGSTAAYWAQHLSEGEMGFPLTVLSLGTNDILGNMAAEGLALDNLVAQLQERGGRVVWFYPPSFRIDQLTEKQEQFASMMTERGVYTLNLVGPQPSVAQDPQHIHLPPDGYRVLAAQIFDALT